MKNKPYVTYNYEDLDNERLIIHKTMNNINNSTADIYEMTNAFQNAKNNASGKKGICKVCSIFAPMCMFFCGNCTCYE